MKKVLMIAQYFPPAGGVGSFRVTKFVKYLRDFYWEPVVLTVREDCYPRSAWLDYGIERDIPAGVHIYRTRVWRSKIINDEGVKWLPFLLCALIKVIRRERPHLLYLTGGPFFPLITGPLMKALFRLPYVVDLRDPWRLAHRGTPLRGVKARLGQLLTHLAEPVVVKYAAKVVCATEQMCKEYRENYCHLPSWKFVTITNGYDPDDFVKVKPIRFADITVVYTGKFRTSEAFRDPVPFFQALRILRERGRRVHFVHVGNLEEEVMNLAKDVGVQDLVEFVGPHSYAEALAYAKGADILLLIGGGQKSEQTGKIFDYIGCKRPILALASQDTEIAKVVREIPNAIVIENIAPETIAAAIEKIYFGWQKMEQAHNFEGRFHRRTLTGLLAKVFDEVLVTGGKISENAQNS